MTANEAFFEELWQEVCRLGANWQMYEVLFGESEETVELLNATAPSFFAETQRLLGDALFLKIWRLRDPNGKTLTLRKMANKLQLGPGEARDKIFRLVDEYESRTAVSEEHRHNRIAHTNTKVALGERDLGSLTRKDFKTIFETLERLMNALHEQVPGANTTDMAAGLPESDDTRVLVKILQESKFSRTRAD